MKTNTFSLILISLLTGFAFLQSAQAVVPPPDGGYPGFNTAEGQNALFSLTTGAGNTAVGWLALGAVTEAGFNTAIGAGALLSNTSELNTATGAGALLNNTTGFGNTATGAAALVANTEGVQNTAIGWNALVSNTTGNSNTAIGRRPLANNTTGSANIGVGNNAGNSVTTAHDAICIGVVGANVSNSCFIGNIRGRTTENNDAIPVLIDSDGQLGTISSSRRFKKGIKAMDEASEAVLALKPVTFHYKSDDTNRPEFGLIAEEVAEVNPNLVVRDENGEIYTVRYDAINAMLLNEFLKEHRKNEEQGAKIARLEKQLETVTATLQKVSAQLELSKPAPQTALND